MNKSEIIIIIKPLDDLIKAFGKLTAITKELAEAFSNAFAPEPRHLKTKKPYFRSGERW